MPTELDLYYQEFMQDIVDRSPYPGVEAADTFFDIVADMAMDEGEISAADRVSFAADRRGRVDGYGGDPQDSDDVLSIIVSDFDTSNDGDNLASTVPTLTGTDMDVMFRRARTFVSQAIRLSHREYMSDSSPSYGLSEMIYEKWDSISRVRIILFTNKILSTRVDRREAEDIESIPCSYSVWDLSRMYRYDSSGRSREDIYIDLMQEFGSGIPAISAHPADSTYRAYITLVRADHLARIYDRWGERLLESNVRVFLHARNKVNREMRTTLEETPEMFFAYNNGLTATADEVETRLDNGSMEIVNLKNFQIVNGAQTTGTIFSARRNKKVDLSTVYVQMKLTVIDSEKSNIQVPKISQYSNSQNKINAADFFANHPFHVRIEDKSRRIYAPAGESSFRQSKWYYERARGQYYDARAQNTTQAKRRAFDEEYPSSQKFVKTDLAKFINVWDEKPHIVSLGAQKNFAEFASRIGKDWESDEAQFSDMYFTHTIAKMIVFKATERIVSNQDWYEAGGYRANIVAYSISKLAFDMRANGKGVDFDFIWSLQSVPSGLSEALAIVSEKVDQVIRNPMQGNISEWAKKASCWQKVSNLQIDWPDSLEGCLITAGEEKAKRQVAKKDQKVVNKIQSQSLVNTAREGFWNEVSMWGLERNLLTETDMSLLTIIASGKVLSEKQSALLLSTLERLNREGCQLVLGPPEQAHIQLLN